MVFLFISGCGTSSRVGNDIDVSNDNSSSDENSSQDESSPSILALPVDSNFDNLKISDSFGPRILSGSYDFHRGLDILLDRNTPILAADDGTITHAGTHDGYPRSGNFVVIKHDQNLYTTYLHLESIPSAIKENATVLQGDKIGYAGDSGDKINSVHLHFNVHEMLPYSIGSPSPEPKIIPMGTQVDHVWKISPKADEQKAIIYRLEISADEAAKLPQLVVEGIESELITGAKAVNV